MKTEIYSGSGNPRGEDFEFTIVEPMKVWTSQNKKHWSNAGPIDNKGNLIIPKGSKYHN